MAENVSDFHMLLPSNENRNYFSNNTPYFRIKLARPISLNDKWECCLTETTIPGKYFAIHTHYNNSYSIQIEIFVAKGTLLPEFNIYPLQRRSCRYYGRI
ncbi:uncharacterized protein CEXT_440241 [Caerostris extrusa]|uniref:LAGLIDADG homing endonuclease n=1 Tax=Caerostris extrusa TaxID=172846 RepID=A0AAV4PUV8_CAEEX|nr:uncharacterized protein CEXT_440241 [Caerostris extrusa]